MTAATCPACGTSVPRAVAGLPYCSGRCERAAALRHLAGTLNSAVPGAESDPS